MSNTIVSVSDKGVIEKEVDFDELIISWKGHRGLSVAFQVQQEAWSPKIEYATWEESRQAGNKQKWKGGHIASDQIIAKGAKGYRIFLEGRGMYTVSIAALQTSPLAPFNVSEPCCLRNFPKLSQMELIHERRSGLCMPTSLSAATSYVAKGTVDAVAFAKRVYDYKGDIFGNWSLGVAQANSYLPQDVLWHVHRLSGFTDIYSELKQGRPVVVSIRGQLQGASLPYAEGHLLCVIGWDGSNVLCMDPALPTHEQTHIAYCFDDFMAAWERRGRYGITLARNLSEKVL